MTANRSISFVQSVLVLLVAALAGGFGIVRLGSNTQWFQDQFCECVSPTADTVLIEIDHFDTVGVPFPVEVPVLKEVRVPFWISPQMDTAAMVYEWLSTHYYEERYQDSLLYVVVKDSIRGNRIVWRDVERGMLRPTTVKFQIIHPTEPVDGLFITTGLAFMNGPGITLGANYTTGKSQFGYDLTILPNSSPIHALKYGWRININDEWKQRLKIKQ